MLVDHVFPEANAFSVQSTKRDGCRSAAAFDVEPNKESITPNMSNIVYR